MRKMVFCLSLVAVFTVGVLLLPKPKLAQSDHADGHVAVVIFDAACTVTWKTTEDQKVLATYDGESRVVSTFPGVWTYICDADLTSGTGPDRTVVTGGDCSVDNAFGNAHAVLYHGGRAHVTCHGMPSKD